MRGSGSSHHNYSWFPVASTICGLLALKLCCFLLLASSALVFICSPLSGSLVASGRSQERRPSPEVSNQHLTASQTRSESRSVSPAASLVIGLFPVYQSWKRALDNHLASSKNSFSLQFQFLSLLFEEIRRREGRLSFIVYRSVKTRLNANEDV